MGGDGEFRPLRTDRQRRLAGLSFSSFNGVGCVFKYPLKKASHHSGA
jgi:hypothetical protein